MAFKSEVAGQEYNFQIKYQKGTHNVAADALSQRCLIDHCALMSLVQDGGERIRDAQQQDPTLKSNLQHAC